MSVDPREAQAFASLLGKLDSKRGPRPELSAQQRVERMADNDMHSILSAFNNKSGTSSALTLHENVKQLGAETKAKNISPVLGKPEKEHPFAGYLVGEGADETEDGVSPDTDQFLSGRTDPTPMGLEKPEGDGNDEVEEAKAKNPYAIGMAQAMKSTGDEPPLSKSTITKAHEIAKAIQKDESVESFAKSLEEQLASFKEDKISKDKKTLSDYIGNKMSAEDVVKAIKTITTDGGKEMKIYGNEDDGFRIRVNNKDSKNVFGSYEEAVMACEMYVARNKNKDYVDEK
jgi:hypothetical protein